MDVEFTINGKAYQVNSKTVPIDTSLNWFIRNHAHLTGTKFMCLEGGCGACVVTAKGVHPVTKEKSTWAINSCLVSVFSCHGLDIVTIEGIGNKHDGYHPIQTRLADLNGTQCGYCSPGMVMNMYSLMESKKGSVNMEEIENSFGGNICRCTGYRPILDAFKSLAVDADKELLDLCKDIEDLNKVCPKTGSRCAGKCSSAINQPDKKVLLSFEDNREWHKVYNINDVFAIFDKISAKPYMLVAGNTAHGVYRRKENLEVFIDISSIEELHSHSLENDLTIGGSVSLTETMSILTDAANKNPLFQYCEELVKHIDLIANVPVRNIGTIAGNLSIKHQYNEFPSDMYLMLETVGAKMTIAESGEKSSVVSIQDFLQTDMNKKIFRNIVLPPLDPSNFTCRTYKIMPRAQNAHAYVNAGFLFEMNEAKNSVISARICFGGINPSFTHATETEKKIIGKNIFDNDVLQSILQTLSGELNPDWVLPDASVEYRKNLAISLFYKFILNIVPEGKVPILETYKSGGQILERPLSSGKQSFDTYKENWPLTQNIPKTEGLAQTSGEAKFCNDFPVLHDELYAAFVIATKPHATIVRIDASDALKVPGIVAFYSAKDIPGENNFTPTKLDFISEAEEIFCSKEVLYFGQPIGVIVATSFNLVNLAAKLVNVVYETSRNATTITPTVKDVVALNAKDKIFDQPYDKEYEEYGQKVGATHRVSGMLEMAGQYHFTMEPQTCVCIPIEDGMDVYAATQWINLLQVAVAESLKVPESSLNFHVRRIGGGYGGKISRSCHVACACALAAHLLNRPVRFVLSIESNMTTVGKRIGCISDYEIEVNDQGKIVKLTNNFIEDYGCSLNEQIEFVTVEFFNNCYDHQMFKIVGKAARTDSASNTWCRAPGSTEGIAMIETMMEHIAKTVKIDPLEVRLVNMTADSKLRELLKDFLIDVEFESRRKDIDEFNASNRWRKRGIAIVPMKHPMAYFGSLHALVSIYHGDGTVAITHGGVEMGQGINTKALQTAAHVLGLPMEKISIKPTTNLTSPNAIVSGGSMTSEVVCYAVKKACEMLLERIKPTRDEMKDATWEQVTNACYSQNVDLCASFFYKHSDLKAYDVWGLSCAEIETDLLTGNVQVTRVDILEDTGESLSPGIDIGQIEGAFVMGIGYYLTESLVYNNENGELLTNRTWTYKPPGAKDIPIDFRIKFLQKSSNPFGVLRSKATGEPALCMSVVVLFALRYALDSARKDAGLPDEWYPLGAPTTPEQIFLAAANKVDQYKIK